MGDKRICDNICLYSYEWPLPLLQGHKTPPERVGGLANYGKLTLGLFPGSGPLPKREFMIVLISQKILLLVS